MAADLVAFDSATVIDRATYAERGLAPEGVRHVVVNGRLALRDGAPTGTAAGRALVRTGHMPSRPTSAHRPRAAEARAPGIEVSLDQAPDDRAAAGRVRLAVGDTLLEATSLGLLQTARDWASVTGRGRFGGREVTVALPERAPATRALPAGGVRVREPR
jgi:hypothetical protein